MIEEGDLVDDLFDDDARGVELVAGVVLAFEYADAQAAAGEDGRAREAGEARADDCAVCGVGWRRGGQGESSGLGTGADCSRCFSQRQTRPSSGSMTSPRWRKPHLVRTRVEAFGLAMCGRGRCERFGRRRSS